MFSIAFHVARPGYAVWTAWRGVNRGTYHQFDSKGWCLKGVYVRAHGGRHGHVKGIQVYFGYWCPTGWDCTNGYAARTLCKPGSFSPLGAYNRRGCYRANRGYFAPRPGMPHEVICPIGTYSPTIGRATCLQSSPGHFVGSSGSTHQTACRAPKYQPRSGQSECLVANAGNYVSTHAARAQVACPPGWYQPKNGQTSCLKCPVGSFQPSSGHRVCLKALPGIVCAERVNLFF